MLVIAYVNDKHTNFPSDTSVMSGVISRTHGSDSGARVLEWGHVWIDFSSASKTQPSHSFVWGQTGDFCCNSMRQHLARQCGGQSNYVQVHIPGGLPCDVHCVSSVYPTPSWFWSKRPLRESSAHVNIRPVSADKLSVSMSLYDSRFSQSRKKITCLMKSIMCWNKKA